MRLIGPAFLAAGLLALTGCARDGGNESDNAVNVAAEEGIEDLNSAVGGDELTPDPEADDDMARNGARDRGAGNAAAPAPATPPAR